MTNENRSVVDGHGPDPRHPPGPELRRLVDALRLINDQIVRADAPPEVLDELAAQAEAIGRRLEPHSPPHQVSLHPGVAADADPHDYFPFSPVIGRFNPMAPPIDFDVRNGAVHGTGTLGAAFEGPPGCVHGGYVAEMMDELLGVANIAADLGSMTGTLTVVYRSPTPLFTELRLEGRSEHLERRKVLARGTVHAGDRLCAEAEGIFVMVDFDGFERRALGET